VCHPSRPMPTRTIIIVIGAVIATPLIFAALGGGRDAGLVAGILLVAVGLSWSAISARRDEGS
jgi:hypothetical protein